VFSSEDLLSIGVCEIAEDSIKPNTMIERANAIETTILLTKHSQAVLDACAIISPVVPRRVLKGSCSLLCLIPYSAERARKDNIGKPLDSQCTWYL